MDPWLRTRPRTLPSVVRALRPNCPKLTKVIDALPKSKIASTNSRLTGQWKTLIEITLRPRGGTSSVAAGAPPRASEPPPLSEFVPFAPIELVPVSTDPRASGRESATGVPTDLASRTVPPELQGGVSHEPIEVPASAGDPGADMDMNGDEAVPDAMGGMDVDVVQDERELKHVLSLMAKEQRTRARGTHDEIICLVDALGHSGRKYRREATQRLRAVVSEVYSAPRVTEAARRHARLGCIPGVALDLTSMDEEGNP